MIKADEQNKGLTSSSKERTPSPPPMPPIEADSGAEGRELGDGLILSKVSFIVSMKPMAGKLNRRGTQRSKESRRLCSEFAAVIDVMGAREMM